MATLQSFFYAKASRAVLIGVSHHIHKVLKSSVLLKSNPNLFISSPFPTSFFRQAKERKVRIWKDYVSKTPEINPAEKNFTGKVIQILYADSIAVKMANDVIRTIHLSSVRPPRSVKTRKLQA